MTKKQDNKIKEIEDFLNKHKISGIIYVPKIGVFNHFRNTNEKLRLLNHSSIEIMFEEKRKEKTVENWLISELDNKQNNKEEIPYIA